MYGLSKIYQPSAEVLVEVKIVPISIVKRVALELFHFLVITSYQYCSNKIHVFEDTNAILALLIVTLL